MPPGVNRKLLTECFHLSQVFRYIGEDGRWGSDESAMPATWDRQHGSPIVKRLALAIALMCLPFAASARNYATCLLDGLPLANNATDYNAVIRACEERYPGGMDSVPQGSGLWFFRRQYSSPQECIADKVRGSMFINSANGIYNACYKLYSNTPS